MKTHTFNPTIGTGSNAYIINFRLAITIDPLKLSEGLVTPPLGVEKLNSRFNFFDMFSCIT